MQEAIDMYIVEFELYYINYLTDRP